MKERIIAKLIEWTILVDPCPTFLRIYTWEVDVDGKTIQIESCNRVLAYIKAQVKYPMAKNIRVIKLLKINRYA